jgi:S1-C subfamily serine protease
MKHKLCALAFCATFAMTACATRYSDDALVASARAIAPSVVLLTMKVPPEHKSDAYDDAFGTGTVIASGAWGSDVMTVQHAVEGAWDMHATIDDKRKAPAKVVAEDKDLDVALVRTTEPDLPVAKLGSSAHLGDDLGRLLGLVGYPIPDEFQDEGLRLSKSINAGHLSSVRNHQFEVSLSIVPGESGAAIFIADTGEIIGIAESRFDDERSIGFALPIDDVKAFLHKHDTEHGF